MLDILHTESSMGWGGQEIRVVQESLGMMKRGHSVSIAAPAGSKILSRAGEAGIRTYELEFRKSRPSAYARFGSFLSREHFDVINTHSSSDSWVGLISGKLKRDRPILIRTRHLSTPISRSPFSRLLYNVLPDAVMTTGEEIRRVMIDINGFDGAKIVSVPTGVDMDRFDPETVLPCLPHDGFTVGMVSVVRSWKGHKYFIESIPRILAAVPQARFVIAGDGPYREVVSGMIRDASLGGKVLMTGHSEQIPEIIRSLDVLVHPSYANEGVPQSVLQAMAMKTPVVASDTGAVKEVVRDGETGFLVPPRNPGLLAERVVELYRKPELRDRFGTEGRKLVAERYSFENMLDTIGRLYGDLLAMRDGER